MPVSALPPEALFHACSPERFSFSTSEELQPLTGLFGQDRALEAIRFGTRMEHAGYNLFVLGRRDAGHGEAVADLLRQLAAEEPVPADWVYVTNFEAPNEPLAISLAHGGGRRLRNGVAAAVSNLRHALPAIFQNEQYIARRKAIDEAFQQRYDEALSRLQTSAAEQGIALISSQRGLAAYPLKADGEPMTPEEMESLSPEDLARFEELVAQLGEAIEDITQTEIPGWEAERIEALHALNQEFAESVVTNVVGELKRGFAGEARLQTWFDSLAADIVENIATFAPQADENAGSEMEQLLGSFQPQGDPFRRYGVNLLVDNAKLSGAPVIALDHVTLGHLVGRVDAGHNGYGTQPDAGHIRPGALHKANGGYLVINARTILSDGMAWEALKFALRQMQVTIESPANYDSYYGASENGALEPETVPLNIKVVLYGPPWLYHTLCHREPDFLKLFKVQVEFSSEIDRSDDSEMLLARTIATMARTDGLKPIDRTGMARMIEFASREADDGERLSILNEPFRDLAREADFQAREAGAGTISGAHVEKALAAQHQRANLMQERILNHIGDDMKLIDTDGTKVGQINSLFVHSAANFRFGSTSRVTVRVRAGVGGVMNIERSVGFGRSIYAKGVEILTAWFMAKFGEAGPVPFQATIAHEQNYGAIDGDSASSTELYALLSALADVPIGQNFACTGSVNQFGEVQVIGGANEKIEGFYDTCAARGLTGNQGVLIPAGNVRHLMLRTDIIDAARAGKFHIYPIETIDEGIELLTGMPAGEARPDGSFPPDSVYGRIAARIADIFPKNGNGNGGGKGGGEPKPRKRGWF